MVNGKRGPNNNSDHSHKHEDWDHDWRHELSYDFYFPNTGTDLLAPSITGLNGLENDGQYRRPKREAGEKHHGR